MNTSRLLETIDELIQQENAIGFQRLLTEVYNQLTNLVNQPNQPQFQTAFANSLQQLQEAYLLMQERFEPAQIKRFEEIEAGPFFVKNIPAEITRRIAENPATPAVVQQFVMQLLNTRQQFVNNLTETKDRLGQLGINANTLEPGEAEVGFTIPRDLFDDNLDGLIAELRELRFIIRAFSEAVNGSVEPIVVKQISTTDPLFFFSVATPTIIAIGKAVHWVLDTWKKVEEVREVRERTRKLQIEGDKALLELFDASIKQTIEAAVEAKVKEVAPSADAADGRARELDIHLRHALDSLFARIERGMTVEIRFIPPPASSDDLNPEVAAQGAAEGFAQLAEISPQLVFPSPAASPVLTLPHRND